MLRVCACLHMLAVCLLIAYGATTPIVSNIIIWIAGYESSGCESRPSARVNGSESEIQFRHATGCSVRGIPCDTHVLLFTHTRTHSKSWAMCAFIENRFGHSKLYFARFNANSISSLVFRRIAHCHCAINSKTTLCPCRLMRKNEAVFDVIRLQHGFERFIMNHELVRQAEYLYSRWDVICSSNIERFCRWQISWVLENFFYGGFIYAWSVLNMLWFIVKLL